MYSAITQDLRADFVNLRMQGGGKRQAANEGDDSNPENSSSAETSAADSPTARSMASNAHQQQGSREPASLHHPPSSAGKGPGQMQHEVDAQAMSDMTVLRELSTYLFPKDNPEFRWRIGTAMSLLVVSKLLNVGVRDCSLLKPLVPARQQCDRGLHSI